MTTMPPEMTSTATLTVTLPTTSVERDSSLYSLQQSTRSRFMITDILAGSAAAAAAVLQNGGNSGNEQHHLQVTKNQQHQQHAALQHYLSQQQQQQQQQQQHLLQQQQYHQQHFPTSATAQINLSAQQHHQLSSSYHSTPGAPPSSPAHPHHSHALMHMHPAALFRYSRNAATANYIASSSAASMSQEEREQDLRDLDSLDDERSRSPRLPVANGGRDSCVSAIEIEGRGGGGVGRRDSSDLVSTIEDSDDSDTDGVKDDDGNSIKSDNLMGLSKKQRKARTAFTDHQLQTLEKSFERQKYLSVQDRMELANKLELSDCQVKTWYQNRRTKWKRQTAVGLELLAEAGNYAAFQRLYGGSPYFSAWPYAAQPPHPHSLPHTPIDLYYRQAAAAAVLQKPFPYRTMYQTMPVSGLSGISTLPPSPSASHISATTNPLTSLSNYYHSMPAPSQSIPSHRLSPAPSECSDKQHRGSEELRRTPSCLLNPGSPARLGSHHEEERLTPSDDEPEGDEVAIEV